MTVVASVAQLRKSWCVRVATTALALGLAGAALAQSVTPAETVPNEDLSRLSLQELSNVQVTSVSKAAVRNVIATVQWKL